MIINALNAALSMVPEINQIQGFEISTAQSARLARGAYQLRKSLCRIELLNPFGEQRLNAQTVSPRLVIAYSRSK